jgi:hypothetical protein
MRYQIKWAKKPIHDYPKTGDAWRKDKYWQQKCAYLNMAKNIAGEPEPGKKGTVEKMTLTAETGDCWFAVRVFDDSHNRSQMSNVVQVTVE